MTFLRLFFEKGIGTCREPYKLVSSKQKGFRVVNTPADLMIKAALRAQMITWLAPPRPAEERQSFSEEICEKVLEMAGME